MSAEFLSCNGLGIGPSQIISGLLRSNSKWPAGFPDADQDIIFTHQGRYAIGLICKLLNIGPGDEVLMPAYNCGAEVDPFVCAGAKVIFYRIDDKASIDKEDIIRRVTPATRIVYVTHFFGWPQEIRELGKWCKEKGIYLVEDCAQSLFSKGPDNTIGRIGDAAIYSYVKSLPMPDGGALVFRKNLWNPSRNPGHPLYGITFRNTLPLLKKWFMVKNRSWQRSEATRRLLTKSWLNRKTTDRSCEPRPEMLKSNCFDERKIGWSMSGLSRGVLTATHPNEIIDKRRCNYKHLQKALLNTPDFGPLFDELPDNVCPLSFPFVVKDRRHWFKSLDERGILVLGWPGYYPGFDWDQYPEACNLKNNLMTLPVHQDLDIHHMEYIAGCVKQIAGGIHK